MKRIQKLTALLLALVLVLALAACGGSGTTTNTNTNTNTSTGSNTSTNTSTNAGSNANNVELPSAEPEAEGIVPGTVVNFRLPVDMTSLSCVVASPNAANVYVQVYDTLFQPYEGDWNDIRGLLCTDYTVSDDGLTWVFTITDKAEFTNGRKLTAQSCVDCWQYTKETQPGLFTNVESFEATGDYEITFHMAAPNPGLKANLANVYSGICDPDAIKEFGLEADEVGIGSGAYYIVSKTIGDRTVLKANPNYWNADQAPHIETINYIYIPDNNTAMAALQSGEIDVIDTNDYNTLEVLESYDGVYSVTMHDQVRVLYINGQHGALQDIRVRQAIQSFIDPVQVELAYHGGHGVADSTIVRDTCAAYVAKSNVTYDVDKGLALLAEAGVDPTSLNLKLVTNSDIAGYSDNVQAQLAAVGITVTIDTYTVGTSEAVIASGDFDLGIFRTDADVASGLLMAQTWWKSDSVKRALWGSAAENSQIDELVAKAAACVTMEEQNEVLKEIQLAILEDAALAVPSPTPGRYYIFNEKLQNVKIDNSTCRVDWRYAFVQE